MKRSRWLIFGSLVLLVLLTVLAVPVYLYNHPLGPALELVMPPDRSALAAAADAVQSAPAESTIQGWLALIFKNFRRTEPASSCGETGKVNLLMLGQSLPSSAPAEQMPSG